MKKLSFNHIKKIKTRFVFAGISVLLSAVCIGYIWLQMDTIARDELLLFFGRFHILIIHFPVSLLLAAALLECLTRFQRFAHLEPAVAFFLGIAALSAISSVLAGFMLATGGGYNESLLDKHMWWGIGTAFFATAAWLLRITGRSKNGAFQAIYGSVLSAAVLCLLLAGYFGGSLTHGQNYLTTYMPQTIKSILRIESENPYPVIENIEEAVLYTDLVLPIIKSRCFSCHDSGRTEGELRLDSFELLMIGGENGPVVVQNNPDQSDLFYRITLPRNHDDRMPPGNRRPLTGTQIELIKWWIHEGASPDLKVAEAIITPEIETLLSVFTEGDSQETGFLFTDVEPADAITLAEITDTGILVTPVSQQHHFLQASFSGISDYQTDYIKNLQKISSQLTWLNLSYTKAADDDLALISVMHALSRLNLNATEITNEGLAHLVSMENLEHLSLVNTGVSDAGLEYVAEIKNLKRLYIWQTEVSEEGVTWLRMQKPELEINHGWTITEPDSIIFSLESEDTYY